MSSARETNIFALVDAIMERRTDVAFRLTQRLMETGSTGPYLLGMIGRQARLVALAQALAQDKVPQAEWDGRLGIAQEFVLRKTIEQARALLVRPGTPALLAAGGDGRGHEDGRGIRGAGHDRAACPRGSGAKGTTASGPVMRLAPLGPPLAYPSPLPT